MLSNIIQLLHGKPVLYKPIIRNMKYSRLIVMPQPLRHTISSHFHAGPTGGHMDKYKALFCIRMIFFWPGIRRDIKTWVKFCAHGYTYDVWRSRKS